MSTLPAKKSRARAGASSSTGTSVKRAAKQAARRRRSGGGQAVVGLDAGPPQVDAGRQDLKIGLGRLARPAHLTLT